VPTVGGLREHPLPLAVVWWTGDQAKRFKEIEKETQRLKKWVAEQALDAAVMSGPTTTLFTSESMMAGRYVC